MALRQSPLAGAHADRGAKTTDFGGWEMPVEFDSIRVEHEAVRSTAGRFDVSHMGQLLVSGPDAAELTDRLVSDDVRGLGRGEACYAAITDEAGVMLDDTVVYHLPGAWLDGSHLVVPNAGHGAEMADRWREHRDAWGLDATVENRTEDVAMVALQGPDSLALLASETDGDLDALGFFEVTVADVAGVEALVANTGYTGEPGVEILCPWEEAATVWSALDCQPCGLGARDTLRLEMGFLLSGQDFDPEENPRTPFEADIGFAVDLAGEFVGRDALADATDPAERLQGVRLDERGVPREGYPVTTPDGDPLGTVTSGTMSPTLGEGIGLAYLPADLEANTAVAVQIRGEGKDARTCDTPFLDR
ncbi:MAG: glycine cleavage system aminomethyltransferase GcvT [Haloarculaceae archaeon]